MDALYIIIGIIAFILVVALGVWAWHAIDRYHMRCAVREAAEYMRKNHDWPPPPGTRMHRVVHGQGSMRSEP